MLLTVRFILFGISYVLLVSQRLWSITQNSLWMNLGAGEFSAGNQSQGTVKDAPFKVGPGLL